MAPPTSYKHFSDTDLVALYRKSEDQLILAELYTRYTSMVYGVCLKYLKDRELAKDAVMTLYEKTVKSLKEHEVGNFRGWIYVSARNHCLMVLRSRKGRHTIEIESVLMESAYAEHPSDDPIEGNLRKLEDCLKTLGPEQEQCVRLFYLQQRCYQEIGTLTGFDYKQVKSYIQNGKRNLKNCMESHGGQD